MSALVRLFEIVTGRPHQHNESHKVAMAAAELTSDVRRLSKKIQPYAESADPLVALMTDIFNARQMHDRHKRGEGAN